MAIEIKIRSKHTCTQVSDLINILGSVSRFTFDIRDAGVKRKDRKIFTGVLTIHNVRLRKSKVYCGSHAGVCNTPPQKNKPFGGKSKYLEGADWVAFNDLINDALDHASVSADVGSFVCNIRRGNNRRIKYTSEFSGVNGEWDKDGSISDYADFCGKSSPKTSLPDGTPGKSTWQQEKEEIC